MNVIATVLIAVLLAIAGLHLYWGFGGRWPGRDGPSLRLMVVGTHGARMYGLGPSAMVGCALITAAAVVWARHSFTAPAWIALAGYAGLVLVFGLRGLAPYLTSLFDYARGTPFFDLNRQIYAPLCLLIAAGFIADFPYRLLGA